MNLEYTIDLDGLEFVKGVTNYSSLLDHRLAHKDKLSLKIRFTRAGVCQDVGTIASAHFTVKKVNEAEEVLSDDSTVTTWTKTTSGTDVYYTHDGLVDLDTVELETWIGSQQTCKADSQFTWTIGTQVYHTRLLKTTIDRALYPATVNPTQATDPQRSWVTILQTVDKLPGDSGTPGDGTYLDDVVTVGLQVPRWYQFLRASDEVMYYYQLRAGTDAESVPSIVRPNDYHATTNAKVFEKQVAAYSGGNGLTDSATATTVTITPTSGTAAVLVSASATDAGILVAADKVRLDAAIITGGSGATLTDLNASELASGIIPDARMPNLTGDVTTSEGAVATTLATVNSNVGSFGSATQASAITVNAKGLITAASSITVTPAESSLTFTDITTNNATSLKHGFLPKLSGSSGDVLKGDGTWAAESAGAGTVTSVAMSVPSILSVAGSPITTSGTLAVTLATQAANLVFAGPATGSDATPTFRSLIAADIPTSIPVNKLAALTASRLVVSDASGFISASSVTSTEAGYLSGVTSALQTQLNAKLDTSTAASTYQPLDADLTTLAGGMGLGGVVIYNSGYSALATLDYGRGGTGFASYATGDLLYGGGVGVGLLKLTGNVTTTKKFLTQTGLGISSAAPAWDTIAISDITSLGTGVATALAVNVGTAGAFVVNGGALGTPSSGTLTSCTGLPISTGVSGLGSNVATFLATPTIANLNSAVSDADLATTGANTFTGQQVVSAAGAASTPAVSLTGATYSGGTATTTKPLFSLEPSGTTSTGWDTAGTGLGINLPTVFAGRALSIQKEGVQVASITHSGLMYTAGLVSNNWYDANGALCAVANGSTVIVGGYVLVQAGAIIVRNDNYGIYFGASDDLHIHRKAAATMQLGDDAAGVTNQGITAASRITSDGVGANLTISGGNGRGGAGGSLILSTYTTGAAATAGTLTTRLTLDTAGLLTFADAVDMAFNTTTGTKIGTATGQKIGFWNATPVVQQVLATGGGATVDNVITFLQTVGLCKQS